MNRLSPRVAQMHNTGKLRIGIAYAPRITRNPSADELRIQTALLEKRTANPVPVGRAVIAKLWGWL